MFENPRRGRQERKFTTNVPKILDLKFRTDIFRKLTFGAPDLYGKQFKRDWKDGKVVFLFFPRPLRSLLLRYTAENSRVT